MEKSTIKKEEVGIGPFKKMFTRNDTARMNGLCQTFLHFKLIIAWLIIAWHLRSGIKTNNFKFFKFVGNPDVL